MENGCYFAVRSGIAERFPPLERIATKREATFRINTPICCPAFDQKVESNLWSVYDPSVLQIVNDHQQIFPEIKRNVPLDILYATGETLEKR